MSDDAALSGLICAIFAIVASSIFAQMDLWWIAAGLAAVALLILAIVLTERIA